MVFILVTSIKSDVTTSAPVKSTKKPAKKPRGYNLLSLFSVYNVLNPDLNFQNNDFNFDLL